MCCLTSTKEEIPFLCHCLSTFLALSQTIFLAQERLFGSETLQNTKVHMFAPKTLSVYNGAIMSFYAAGVQGSRACTVCGELGCLPLL